MTLTIFGAGAIGAYMAGKLANAGVPVRLLARPATAARLHADGLIIEENGQTLHLRAGELLTFQATKPVVLPCAREPVSPADILLITVKSHQLLAALPDIAPFVGPRTLLACLQNGIPWWYFHGLQGALAGRNLQCLDPEGRLSAALPLARLLGGVIQKSAEQAAPGRIVANPARGDAFLFGSPLPGLRPEGTEELLSALASAGLNPRISDDIRRDVWIKLLGNAVFNPLSALANADLAAMLAFPPARQLIRDGMAEVLAVARAHGVSLDISLDARLQRAEAVGAFRTSMLQDKLKGRALEIDAILGGLLELARLAQISVPHLETLYAATALMR
ncbi:MAG: 2-dehydropantoate 2-reductase [Azoarcus sp.]|jgi:2-dehydropantoate 2-reductase|nr:2-dehydropantoate 2-reductase [Azoarcus sp.]